LKLVDVLNERGITSKPKGIEAIAITPKSCGVTFGKTGYKYHSGRNFKRCKGFAGSPDMGSKTEDDNTCPRITTGKMYSRSLGQAGYNKCDHALGKFSRNIGSLISGFFFALPSLTVLSFVSSV